jgi:D-glycero-D-manno-heptose 1,7-bisphosphate phosphatase
MDRDGVINQKAPEGEYITRWEDFHFLPGVTEAIALLNRAGLSVIVVTNQRCIAKGLMTVTDLEKMHERMNDFLERAGAAIDGIYYCPHELGQSCSCRKPAPGMLLEAARCRGIELPASWMIGDSDIDIEAGKNAGCKTARLMAITETTNEAGSREGNRNRADIVALSLLDAVREILHQESVAVGSAKVEPAAS